MAEPLTPIKRIDRSIGYFLAISIVVTIGSVLGIFLNILLNPPQKRVILFDNIGHIGPDDEVQIKGIIVGKISKIEPYNKQVAVTIELPSPISIHKDYKITTFDRGIMGDRIISIDQGSKSEPLIPPSDTLDGIFYIGISEILGLADHLVQGVAVMKKTLNEMLNGTDKKPSFVYKFNDIFTIIDSISTQVKNTMQVANAQLKPTLDTINKYSNIVSSTTGKAQELLPSKFNSIDNGMVKINNSINKLESILDTLEKYTDKLNDKDALIWADDINKASKDLRKFHDIANEIYLGTTKLKLILSRWKD